MYHIVSYIHINGRGYRNIPIISYVDISVMKYNSVHPSSFNGQWTFARLLLSNMPRAFISTVQKCPSLGEVQRDVIEL